MNQHAKCPVCGMDVDPSAAPSSTYEGKTYNFCSEGCQRQFESDPERYSSNSV